MSTWFAVAAGAALIAGGGGYRYAASYRPPVKNDFPRYIAPPTQQELAAIVERRGLRLCTMGYYGERADVLDQADKLDPETEKHPAVIEARRSIASAESGQSPIRMPDHISKPPLGPGERPLQRRP